MMVGKNKKITLCSFPFSYNIAVDILVTLFLNFLIEVLLKPSYFGINIGTKLDF